MIPFLDERAGAPAKVEAEVCEVCVGVVAKVEDLLALPPGHLRQLGHVALKG